MKLRAVLFCTESEQVKNIGNLIMTFEFTSRSFLIIAIWISLNFSTTGKPIDDMSLDLSPEVIENNNIKQTIQNDNLIANNVLSLVPPPLAPTGNQFGLILSKTFEPFGKLFFSVNKWDSDHLQPAPQHFHQISSSSQNLQLEPLQQPQQDLSILGHVTPNVKPLIHTFPSVLVSGYKTFLDKIWSKNLVWDASIELPAFLLKKVGKFGIDLGGYGSVHKTKPSGHEDISSLIDIRDPPQQVNWKRKLNTSSE